VGVAHVQLRIQDMARLLRQINSLDEANRKKQEFENRVIEQA
jgi:hypothetical protein